MIVGIGDRGRDRDWDRDRWNDRHRHYNDWYNRHYDHHHHWHHGSWNRPWRAGYRWNYWWDRYPVLTAFGITTWGINRAGWAFGYNDYYNPYATTVVVDNSVYNYSQPLILTPDEQSLAGDPNAVAPLAVPDASLAAFDQARQEFYAGDYAAALASTDAALTSSPNDAVIHEFRALVLFAQGNYQESAAVLYAVLSVGPGWDWTTMSGLYPSVAVYTPQLRALEAARSANPSDPALRLVLAYHYLTAGHEEDAAGQLQKLLSVAPEDQLAKQLLLQLDPDAEIPDPPKAIEPPKPESPISEVDIRGSWAATRNNSKYAMTLKEDGTYSWKYQQGEQVQEVTGVWGLDEEGVLALEMNDEGAMLAQIILNNGEMDFYMLGDTTGSDPLKFKKN